MKPQKLHRQGNIRITLVAFRYDRAQSIGYVWCKDEQEVAKQVTRFLSDPNNADVISIRRVYVQDEELKQEPKEIKYPGGFADIGAALLKEQETS